MRAAVVLVLVACGGSPDEDFDFVCGDGIVDESCDDGNLESGDGCSRNCVPERLVTVHWAFYPSVNGSAQTGCRAGVETVELVTQDGSVAFPCVPQSGQTWAAFDGRAGVFARLRSGAGDIIAESLPIPTIGDLMTAKFYEDGGFVRASWQFSNAQNVPVQCGTSMLALSITPTSGGTMASNQMLPCSSFGIVASEPKLAGTYDVILHTPRGPQFQYNVGVGANNRITDLAFAIE